MNRQVLPLVGVLCAGIILLGAWSSEGEAASSAVSQSGAGTSRDQVLAAGADMPARLDGLSEDVKGVSSRLDSYVRLAVTASSVVMFLLAVAGVIGYQQLRNWATGYVEKNLSGAIDAAVKQSLPGILAEAQERAESHIFRVAQVLALRTNQAHDDALTEYGWDGKVAALRAESPTLRRALIDCLYSGRANRAQNRPAAWEAMTELLQDDQSIDTVRLYLRISTSMRKLQEGAGVFDRFKKQILGDQDAAVWAATLLRRLGRRQEAVDLLRAVSDPGDNHALVEIAAIERDLGDFDEAHDRLLPAVNRLVSQPSVQLPQGWHRVLNTYVANCIDRGRLEDAIGAAEFVLRSGPGPVEVRTVGGLIAKLPTTHPKRSQLEGAFSQALERQFPCEAKTTALAVQKQLQGKMPDAMEILREAIRSRGTDAGGRMPVEVYYWRCLLAEILVMAGTFDGAIDELRPAADFAYGGEAKYLLAVAYARQGDNKEAARWLKSAANELPKWAARARDHDVLGHIPEVAEVLAQRTADRVAQASARASTPAAP